MQAFITLAGQLLLIACVQSILDVMTSSRKQAHLQKTIALGCYIASLVLVLHFMEVHLSSILFSLSRKL